METNVHNIMSRVTKHRTFQGLCFVLDFVEVPLEKRERNISIRYV